MHVCDACLETLTGYEKLEQDLYCECTFGPTDEGYPDPTDNCDNCKKEVSCGFVDLTNIRFLTDPVIASKKPKAVAKAKTTEKVDSFANELAEIRKREKELVDKIKRNTVVSKFNKESWPDYQEFLEMTPSELDAILEENQNEIDVVTHILKTYDSIVI